MGTNTADPKKLNLALMEKTEKQPISTADPWKSLELRIFGTFGSWGDSRTFKAAGLIENMF